MEKWRRDGSPHFSLWCEENDWSTDVYDSGESRESSEEGRNGLRRAGMGTEISLCISCHIIIAGLMR